jgi:hypothetical protein
MYACGVCSLGLTEFVTGNPQAGTGMTKESQVRLDSTLAILVYSVLLGGEGVFVGSEVLTRCRVVEK